MSIRVLSWVLESSTVTSKGDLLALIVLADHAHDDGGGAYPSVLTIARKARLSERGARTALRQLESAGHIDREGVSAKGMTIYRVRMTPAATAPGSHCPRQPLPPGSHRSRPRQPVPPDPGSHCPRTVHRTVQRPARHSRRAPGRAARGSSCVSGARPRGPQPHRYCQAQGQGRDAGSRRPRDAVLPQPRPRAGRWRLRALVVPRRWPGQAGSRRRADVPQPDAGPASTGSHPVCVRSSHRRDHRAAARPPGRRGRRPQRQGL
jgi:hypothetical protein